MKRKHVAEKLRFWCEENQIQGSVWYTWLLREKKLERERESEKVTLTSTLCEAEAEKASGFAAWVALAFSSICFCASVTIWEIWGGLCAVFNVLSKEKVFLFIDRSNNELFNVLLKNIISWFFNEPFQSDNAT